MCAMDLLLADPGKQNYFSKYRSADKISKVKQLRESNKKREMLYEI